MGFVFRLGAVKPFHFSSEGWFAGGKPSRCATASNELKIRSARPSGSVCRRGALRLSASFAAKVCGKIPNFEKCALAFLGQHVDFVDTLMRAFYFLRAMCYNNRGNSL
jgi:hypothetical protein